MELFMLIGVVGTGKSTFINNVLKNQYPDIVVISTDDYIEKYAKSKGLTYNQVFNEYISTATSLIEQDIQKAISENRRVVWDQTNLTRKSRKPKLDNFKYYAKTAIVFDIPEQSEWKHRLDSRPGKVIPPNVIESMIKNFEHPTFDEGFDNIYKSTTYKKC